jgi:hypothetical protein
MRGRTGKWYDIRYMGKFTFNPQYDEPDVTWDKNNPSSVEAARRFFASYTNGEARVFKVDPKGELTEVHTFDPDYDTLYVYYFGGGC